MLFPLITVDSRPSGCGKTTTTIYQKIRTALKNLDKIIIVVPTVSLQYQYKESFNKIQVINSKNTYENVQIAIGKAVLAEVQIICITHEAWVQSSIPIAARLQYHLIIDEVPPVISSGRYHCKQSKIDWHPLFTQPTFSDGMSFAKLDINNHESNSFLDDIKLLQQMKNTNYTTYISEESYANLGLVPPSVKDRRYATIIQTLNIDILAGFKSVHIAAAAFALTFGAAWLKSNDQAFVIPAEYEFFVKTLLMRLHLPVNCKWSLRKQFEQPEYIKQYSEYVNGWCSTNDIDIIALRNNSSTNRLEREKYPIDESGKEVFLLHQSHGLNYFSDYAAISLESALNPSREVMQFLKWKFGMDRREVLVAYQGYLMYQIIMRTCLRNSDDAKVCDVFMPSSELPSLLMSFVGTDIPPVTIPFVDAIQKKKPMTNAERQRALRQRKKLLKQDSNQ